MPIKFISNVKNVDPLVMQTYKSIVLFLTCWLVIPLGEPFKFTPWGILSGLFFVPGATAGIYGILNAGLAISVGTWSSLHVVCSLCWGILVFNEKIRSIQGTCGAALTLIVGLVGMSIFSAPAKKNGESVAKGYGESNLLLKDSKEVKLSLSATSSEDQADVTAVEEAVAIAMTNTDSYVVASPSRIEKNGNEKMDEKKEDEFQIFGGKCWLSRRQLGILGALINGVWGGNKYIPLHYASKEGYHGAGYLISYSTGSMLITIIMWLMRYIYNLYCWDFDRIQAYNALPSFHLREMWLAGLLAGGFYSLGNLCSIMAVTSLGQGVGFSLCQTQMLVSGVWGIFFFGEVQGFNRIFKWLLSSVLTVVGILWLSNEHQGAVSHT